MSTSDSYIIQDVSPESSNDHDDVDSLPSSIDSSDLDSEEESDAQKEWEASLQQLELVLTMIAPVKGNKYWFWFYRLGKVYGVDVSCRGQIYE